MNNRKNPIKRLMQRGKSHGVPNFIQCFEDKLAELKKTIRPHRYQGYCKVHELFLGFVAGRKVIKVDELSLQFTSDLAAWIENNGKTGKPLARRTAKTYLLYCQSILKYALEQYRLTREGGWYDYICQLHQPQVTAEELLADLRRMRKRSDPAERFQRYVSNKRAIV